MRAQSCLSMRTRVRGLVPAASHPLHAPVVRTAAGSRQSACRHRTRGAHPARALRRRRPARVACRPLLADRRGRGAATLPRRPPVSVRLEAAFGVSTRLPGTQSRCLGPVAVSWPSHGVLAQSRCLGPVTVSWPSHGVLAQSRCLGPVTVSWPSRGVLAQSRCLGPVAGSVAQVTVSWPSHAALWSHYPVTVSWPSLGVLTQVAATQCPPAQCHPLGRRSVCGRCHSGEGVVRRSARRRSSDRGPCWTRTALKAGRRGGQAAQTHHLCGIRSTVFTPFATGRV
jgi:hypothetical protein